MKIWTDFSSTCLTDGHTDKRTDQQTDRILIARPRLHSMQRGKKYAIVDVTAGVCKPYGRHVTMTSQLEVDRWVEGVALFDDRIFVVYDQCDVITVYSQHGLETLGGIKVGGLQLPNDLVCCCESRQLYVADLSHCVWRVSVDDYRVKKWIPNRRAPEDFSPLSLSVTSRQVMSSAICNSASPSRKTFRKRLKTELHCVRKKRDQMFFVITSIKHGRFR